MLDWFLPRHKGKPGLGRRLLRFLGRSWLASPLRRTVQLLSLLLFIWLFLFVCWPYTAERARIWPGWVPVNVDSATGRATVAAEQSSGDAPALGTLVFPVEKTADGEQSLGSFRVAELRENELILEPDGSLDQNELDRLAMSIGPWLLRETEPGSWPSHYADDLAAKEFLPAESFLAIDPLMSLSTAIASRTWIWSLSCAAVLIAVCLFIPRGFCGYLCPLGTLIDFSDRLVARRIHWFRLPADGWWINLKYYLLLATLLSAAMGVVAGGFVAAMPIVTRGLVFLVTPLQTAAERGWHQVPPMTPGQWLSVGLFAGVFIVSLLGPRFWCRCLCPTGAILSLATLLRFSHRTVADTCISCGQCIDACSFNAVTSDFTTRTTDCTFCQVCGGVCPAGSIQFRARWKQGEPATADNRPNNGKAIRRRGFLASALGLLAGAVGGLASAAAISGSTASRNEAGGKPSVRPPGSVPEEQFLRICVRCGECLQACPNDVLQPSSFEQGPEGLWTPRVAADWSGCEPSCNNCGQVCPTGAIRAIPLEEKRVARMGLAVVNKETCLPYAGEGDCQLCVDECKSAGYRAIEFVRVGTELDAEGRPLADSGFLAPVVLADLCVGCGLCQARCHGMNVVEKKLLGSSAIVVEAGDGKEDRLMRGSYISLREAEKQQPQHATPEGGYLPDFLK